MPLCFLVFGRHSDESEVIASMAEGKISGKVKWFDNQKGYGFISQDGGPDVFVHHTSIQGNGFKTLTEGEAVEFEVIVADKGPKAANVNRVAANP